MGTLVSHVVVDYREQAEGTPKLTFPAARAWACTAWDKVTGTGYLFGGQTWGEMAFFNDLCLGFFLLFV